MTLELVKIVEYREHENLEHIMSNKGIVELLQGILQRKVEGRRSPGRKDCQSGSLLRNELITTFPDSNKQNHDSQIDRQWSKRTDTPTRKIPILFTEFCSNKTNSVYMGIQKTGNL